MSKREIIYIDIANDPVAVADYREDEDPTKFLSKKTGRGELKPNWKDTTKPIMCAYKLCTVEFKWFGLQTRVEKFIQTVCVIYLCFIILKLDFINYLKLRAKDVYLQNFIDNYFVG